ncbi:hypothetical protein H0G86_000959 [Trichoderma simmonsii]|uniref:Uncharacterized protein n=1 Tax=Trichoderma simmonsii TaxID=1491479 RepID=A0A8G0L5C9_9HYPO|nr:hypothetical protein H0G86_000959 [Trichoderma simmonsii]
MGDAAQHLVTFEDRDEDASRLKVAKRNEARKRRAIAATQCAFYFPFYQIHLLNVVFAAARVCSMFTSNVWATCRYYAMPWLPREIPKKWIHPILRYVIQWQSEHAVSQSPSLTVYVLFFILNIREECDARDTGAINKLWIAGCHSVAGTATSFTGLSC